MLIMANRPTYFSNHWRLEAESIEIIREAVVNRIAPLVQRGCFDSATVLIKRGHLYYLGRWFGDTTPIRTIIGGSASRHKVSVPPIQQTEIGTRLPYDDSLALRFHFRCFLSDFE